MIKIILAILLLASPCLAGYESVIQYYNAGGGSSCDTLQDSEDNASGTSSTFAQFSTTDWQGTKFTAGASYTVCKIVLPLEEVGDLSGSGGTITACIYSHDAGEDDPNAEIGCSDAVNKSTINDGGSETEYTFSNVSAAITSGTTYHVVLKSSDNDASNYIRWHRTGAAAVELITYDGDGTGTWTDLSAFNSGKYKLYE